MADVLDILQIFETCVVLEGNLFQVVVINNELPNPVQLNIETLSRHEIKCTVRGSLTFQ